MLRFCLLVFCLTSATCSELLNRHKRTWIIDSFTIEEGHPGPFPYELGVIKTERAYRVLFDLYGEGVDEEPKGVLTIDKESGILYVHRAVDYEEKKTLSLKFEAKKTDASTDTKLGVEIYIKDINDNPPRFLMDLYEISVDEETTQGSHLLTVVAFDRDQRGTPNSTFHYEIKSVSPDPPETEFVINESGTISFKGCLDLEVAEMFTLLVEAIDHGEVVSLSSSTTVVIHVQDGNNHIPVISGQTGSCRVKEQETGSSPLRLHVTDKDTPHSPAWRARYSIEGDEGQHFKIETDPDTNDGILSVVKPLDFEEAAQRELSISVENVAPYFYCKVRDKTSSGLWSVETGGDGLGAGQSHPVKVIIHVEDVNDPPVFSVTVKDAQLEENAPVGTWVEKVSAFDRDSSHARDFVYKVGSDPAGWVTVDPHTGDITTVTTPDRESPHVVDGVYTILMHAVDNGEPPLTGTATLQIHVIDRNDNVPQPAEQHLDVCASDGPTTTDITAFDPDGNPFGGPFTFELLGDVKGKWKLNPSYGFTAGLVREPGAYVGPHTIKLKIYDMQAQFGVYNLSVTVCDCSGTAVCPARRHATTTAASGAIGVALASLALLVSLLLMAVTCSCKRKFSTLEMESPGETLLQSNTEKPGTDCEVPDGVLPVSTDKKHHDPWNVQTLRAGMQTQFSTKQHMEQNLSQDFMVGDYRERESRLLADSWNQTTWNSFAADDYYHTHQFEDVSTTNFHSKRNSSYVSEATLLALLHRKLSSLQEAECELLDYQPHLYVEEGDCDDLPELENIIVPDDESLQKALKDLGPKFAHLASICKPPQTKN